MTGDGNGPNRNPNVLVAGKSMKSREKRMPFPTCRDTSAAPLLINPPKYSGKTKLCARLHRLRRGYGLSKADFTLGIGFVCKQEM